MADSPADGDVVNIPQLLGGKQKHEFPDLANGSSGPTHEFREEALVVSSNMSDLEKIQCLMTLALQKNAPWNVFTIAAAHGIRKGTSGTTDILTKCASQMIDIDEMVKEHGIVPPPPSFIPVFPDHLTPFRYARRKVSKSENTHKSQFFRHPKETIQKLTECFESFKGKVTAAQAEEVAIFCDTTANRVKVFFKSHRANLRRAKVQQEKAQQGSSRNDGIEVFTIPDD